MRVLVLVLVCVKLQGCRGLPSRLPALSASSPGQPSLSDPLLDYDLLDEELGGGNRTGAAERCGPCEPDLCPETRGCRAGLVPDPCGCCLECGNLEGQACDPGDRSRFYGLCGSGLRCEAERRPAGGAPGPEEEEEEEEVPRRKGPSLESILGPMPSSSTLGLPESISSCMENQKENDGAADSGELDLSGIDDSEIELYLLDDKEVKIKTALWMAENSDYLKEQKEKEAKIAKEKELGIYKERKPRGPSKRRPPIRASTADEAIEKMLEQKKISSKINYDVLKDLNIKPGSSPARKTESPKKEPTAAKLTGRNRTPARTPLSLSTPLSSLGKRLQPFISGQPNKKQAVEQTSNPLPVAVGASAGESVVVESGPVVYDDGAADEEDEDEEEACVSAMELMGGNDYGFDGDDDGF